MLEHIPQCITTQDNYTLTKEIEEVEIVQAIWSLEQDKALDLMVFNKILQTFLGLNQARSQENVESCTKKEEGRWHNKLNFLGFNSKRNKSF
jgi:hypothetical protein